MDTQQTSQQWLSLRNLRGGFTGEKEAAGGGDSSAASNHTPSLWAFPTGFSGTPLSCHGVSTAGGFKSSNPVRRGIRVAFPSSFQPPIRPLMSPGGHEKSGNNLLKTSCVQGTGALGVILEQPVRQLSAAPFSPGTQRGLGQLVDLPAQCWTAQAPSPLPIPMATTSGMDAGLEGSDQAGKRRYPWSGVSWRKGL